MENKHILFGISGSFCNHHAILKELEHLCEQNVVQCVVSENVFHCSTRYFNNKEFIALVEKITGKEVIHTIVEAEKVGPNNNFDIMVIAPMTASVAAKLAHGIYDHPITLAAKAMIRNHKNIVFGIASNDGLGISGSNVMHLLALKNIYAIPFRQDDPFKKERSIVAEWTLLETSLEAALQHKQLQPLILGGK